MVSRKVLVVDDSFTARRILVQALNDLNAEVIEAENSIIAKEILLKDPSFSLIFTDVNMPEQNGLKFVEEIKCFEKLKNIPICVFTSTNDDDTLQEMKTLGIDAFFGKPIQKEQLKIIVEKILGHKETS